jgi:hypothetical protein
MNYIFTKADFENPSLLFKLDEYGWIKRSEKCCEKKTVISDFLKKNRR